jgi:hypothetical protein
VRMMTLLSLDEQARAADLQPSSIEEIADKEYVEVVLRDLGGAITAASGLLNAKHRQTIDWLNENYSLTWSFHEDEIDKLAKAIEVDENLEEPATYDGFDSSTTFFKSIFIYGPAGAGVAIWPAKFAAAKLLELFKAIFDVQPTAEEDQFALNTLLWIGLALGYTLGCMLHVRDQRRKVGLPLNPKEQAHYDGRIQRIAANQSRLNALKAQDAQARAAQAAHRAALQQILQAHPLLSNLGYTADPSPSGRLLALT